MSTFTTRAGTTTCDRCAGPVGHTWQQRAQHLCTRTRPTIAPRPRCEECDETLTRRLGEGLNDYRRRRFCNRSCAATHSNKERHA